MSFPIDRQNERTLPQDFEGDVITCDIDRTYLATRFSSLKGLMRIPFEFGVDKKDIAGMAVLLKELRRGPELRSRHTPLYFVSASPAQLRGVVERKMLLDGLEYDGTTFKDWGRVLRSRRPRRLREQLGYKVTALLSARSEMPPGAGELLFGDDLESDAMAFCCYADLVSGTVMAEQAAPLLESLGVAPDDAAHAAALAGKVAGAKGVRRSYIRLERHAPEFLLEFAPHVRACRGAFQLACGLVDDVAISKAGALRVAKDLVDRGADAAELQEQLVDAVTRGVIAPDVAEELFETLAGASLLAPAGARLPREVDGRWTEERAGALPKRYTAAIAG